MVFFFTTRLFVVLFFTVEITGTPRTLVPLYRNEAFVESYDSNTSEDEGIVNNDRDGLNIIDDQISFESIKQSSADATSEEMAKDHTAGREYASTAVLSITQQAKTDHIVTPSPSVPTAITEGHPTAGLPLNSSGVVENNTLPPWNSQNPFNGTAELQEPTPSLLPDTNATTDENSTAECKEAANINLQKYHPNCDSVQGYYIVQHRSKQVSSWTVIFEMKQPSRRHETAFSKERRPNHHVVRFEKIHVDGHNVAIQFIVVPRSSNQNTLRVENLRPGNYDFRVCAITPEFNPQFLDAAEFSWKQAAVHQAHLHESSDSTLGSDETGDSGRMQ